MTTPTERIGAGIAASTRKRPTSPAEARLLKVSGSWRYDEGLEQLLRLKQERPERFDTLPANLKMSAGYYASGKAAAQEVGRDTGPEAA